ncbi:MAG: Xaa-Pro peptidase family protein [Phycisphaerales bacterium]
MTDKTNMALPGQLIQACERRQHRLRQAMSEHPIDALLVSSPKDIHYLTGFVGHDSVLMVTDSAAVIITDSRYDEFLDPWRGTRVAEVVMGTRHRLEDAVAAQCKSRGVWKLGIEAEWLTVSARTKVTGALTQGQVVDTVGLVGRFRMVKDELELAAIERAGSIQRDALNAARSRFEYGMTERELCAVLEFEMKTRGASGPSFDTMVLAGPNSAIIHALTGETRIDQGTLLIDWGAVFNGYCSDMTRTFAVGAFPEKVREIYDIVAEAQQTGIDACGPGKTCAEVDAAARSIIHKAGYGEFFGHGLGHGLGLDIHEEPYFNELATDIVLQPGMVMTVEPGIYLPGIGGVRIEDDVVITSDGCRVLTNFPKHPDEMVIEVAMATRGSTK